jgi:hypothetical protein
MHMMEQRMKSCSYALSNPLPQEDIMITPISEEINSTDSEYGIEWSGDSLILFSSLRGSYNENWELDSADSYYARIYKSQADNYGFSEVSKLEISNLDENNHLLYPSLTKDGNRMFFSVCDDDKNCQLAIAKKTRTGFEFEKFLLESYGDIGSNSQAEYIEHNDNEYLIFSSNRTGGYGGYDLWIGELKENDLTDVENLGPAINSPGNEMAAHHNREKEVLYFSSDRHPGYGGYDIFSIPYTVGNQITKAPLNLGLPINSSVNDVFYSEEGPSRYLTSNRPGSFAEDSTYCCTDIYEIKEIAADSSIVNEDRTVPASIESVDELKGLLPISLYFHNDIPDPGSQSNSTDLSYDVTISGYTDLQDRYTEEYSEGKQDSLGVMARESMTSFFDNRIVAEFEKLEGVSRLLLTELEKGMRIEIAIKGYASPLAQSDYNRKLTQRRIQSIINYLKELDEGAMRKYMNGDDPELKIRAIPFGEEESDSFVSDNPLDAKNSIYSIAAMRERRVEILRIQEQ